MLLALLLTSTLSQAPAPQAASTEERTAEAAERSARAAERVAAAVEKLAGHGSACADEGARKPDPDKHEDEKVEEDTADSSWRGSVGVGLTWLSGNAESLTSTALLSLERKWNRWALAGKASGGYGQSRAAVDPNAAPQVVALRAGGSLRGDRRFGEKMSAFLQAGAETDHVKSIEVRGSGEAGASATWVDLKTKTHQVALVRTDLSIRYTDERRFQYYPTPANLPDLLLVGPRVAVAAVYGLSKDTFFSQEADVTPNIVGEARVLVNSTTKLSTRLGESVLLTTSFQLAYDSMPAAGKRPLDTILTAGLELGL